MDTIELDYGFFSEMPHVQDEYASEIEKQLRELAKDHTDLMGAHVTVSELAHRASPFIYEATIVAYVRRENPGCQGEIGHHRRGSERSA
jgi:hypothetical protein